MLQAHRADLDRFHVKSIALFGSVARDEARPDSDIDLLVEFDESPVSLFDFVALHDFLEQLFARKVDLVQRGTVKRQLRERVYGEAIHSA